jgi:hypothetical protein
MVANGIRLAELDSGTGLRSSVAAVLFLHDFWKKILRIFVRETSPGALRAAQETSTSAISHVLGGAYPPTAL